MYVQQSSVNLKEVLNRVFETDLRTVQGCQAFIYVDPSVKPCKILQNKVSTFCIATQSIQCELCHLEP